MRTAATVQAIANTEYTTDIQGATGLAANWANPAAAAAPARNRQAAPKV